MANLKYLLNAIENEPGGRICGFCGKINNFCDDIGFFYVESYFFNPPDIYLSAELKPCCEKCYYGEIGQLHREKYGVGER